MEDLVIATCNTVPPTKPILTVTFRVRIPKSIDSNAGIMESQYLCFINDKERL